MDELAKDAIKSLFSSVSYHESGFPASFSDVQYLKLYDDGEGADDWETILFRNNIQKEEWLYTRLHPNGRNGYIRTTSGGRRWHSRDKKDILLGDCWIKRTRFTLKYKNPTRSTASSDAYTMFEYTTGGNDQPQFALCKITKSKKKANGLGRLWSSKQSTELVPSLFNTPMAPIMMLQGTDHEHVNITNFCKGENSCSRADDFMQDGTSYAVLDQSMNNLNCSGIEIKEPTDEGLTQSNYWPTLSPHQIGGFETNTNEAHVFTNSGHAFQTSMPVANNLIDSSPASVDHNTHFSSLLFQPNVDINSSFGDWDYSGNSWNY